MTYAAPSMMQAPPQAGLVEAKALRKVVWFGTIQLLALMGGWVGWLYFFTSGFWFGFSSLGPNPTPAQISRALDPVLRDLEYLVIPSLVLGIIAIVLLTSAFRDLAKVDNNKFGTPSTLMYVYIAGLVILSIGAVPFLANISSLISQVPTTAGGAPSQAFFSSLGRLVLYLVLLGIGGILVLVGVIGGAILGLWRVGSKYEETILKIGAIFIIIPLVSIVAPILILIGAWEAKKKLPAA